MAASLYLTIFSLLLVSILLVAAASIGQQCMTEECKSGPKQKFIWAMIIIGVIGLLVGLGMIGFLMTPWGKALRNV